MCLQMGFNFSKALLNFILFYPQLSHTASEKQTSNHVLKQRLSVNFKEKSVYSSDQYCVEGTYIFISTDINLKSFQSSLQFLWVSPLRKTSQSLCSITPATHTVTHYIPCIVSQHWPRCDPPPSCNNVQPHQINITRHTIISRHPDLLIDFILILTLIADQDHQPGPECCGSSIDFGNNTSPAGAFLRLTTGPTFYVAKGNVATNMGALIYQ